MSAPIHTTERRKVPTYCRELYEAALVAVGAWPEGHPNSDIFDAQGAHLAITDAIMELQRKIGRMKADGRREAIEILERADVEKAELRAQLAAAQKQAEEWQGEAGEACDFLATSIGIGGTKPMGLDKIRETPEFHAWWESQPRDETTEKYEAWIRSRSMVKP